MALVAFDFHGTLSESDATVLLGKEHGVGTEVEGLAERGRRGDLLFEESLRERVALLEGLPVDGVDAAFEQVRLRDGAADLLGSLRDSGHRVAIVTGSFARAVESALERAGVEVDSILANRLPVENGALAGVVEGPLVEDGKDAALQRIVATEGVDLDRTIAVGDDVTDLPMLQVAATAIGFDPHPEVERYADEVVHSIGDLRLYFEQHGIVEE